LVARNLEDIGKSIRGTAALEEILDRLQLAGSRHGGKRPLLTFALSERRRSTPKLRRELASRARRLESRIGHELRRYSMASKSNASEVQDDKMQNQDDDNDSMHMRPA
jgi:hypothetical protein